MKTITKHIVTLILCLSVSGLSAQSKLETTIKSDKDKAYKMELLEKQKEEVEESERGNLKRRITAINNRGRSR